MNSEFNEVYLLLVSSPTLHQGYLKDSVAKNMQHQAGIL